MKNNVQSTYKEIEVTKEQLAASLILCHLCWMNVGVNYQVKLVGGKIGAL